MAGNPRETCAWLLRLTGLHEGRLESHPRIVVSRICLHDICLWVPTRLGACFHELLCNGFRRTIRCAKSTYATRIKAPSQPMRSHHDCELVGTSGVIDLVAQESSRGGIALHQVAHPQLKIGTHDDICVPQASIAIIDLLDDGPCEVCAHEGLASSQAMLGQVCSDVLFQHLGTAVLKLRTIHVCTLDAIQIHGRVRST